LNTFLEKQKRDSEERLKKEMVADGGRGVLMKARRNKNRKIKLLNTFQEKCQQSLGGFCDFCDGISILYSFLGLEKNKIA